MIERGAIRWALALCLATAAPASGQVLEGILGGVVGGVTPWILGPGSGPGSDFQATLDTSRIQMRILDSLDRKLGLTLAERSRDTRCYERWKGQKAYEFCFRTSLKVALQDSAVAVVRPWGAEALTLAPNQAFLAYGFSARTGDEMGWDSHNLAAFLNSAYHQELYPEYRAREDRFLSLPRKSQWGLWSRGLLSMGWGVDYASRRNPFMTGGAVRFVKWMLYGFDAAFFTGMVVTAAQAGSLDQGWKDALRIKAFHAGLSGGIFTPLISLELSETLRLQDSGYRFPVGLVMEW